MNDLLVITKLYGPILLFIVVLLLTFFIRESKDGSKVSVNFFGLFKHEVFIRNVHVSRVLSILAAFACLSVYLIYDYTSFFPDRLTMEVFFDKAGLRKSLEEFTSYELRDLNIVDNYEEYQNIYYSDLDEELRKILSSGSFFTLKEGIIHSEGKTSFIVEKIGGLQNYYVVESQGHLTHILEQPQAKKISFKSFFEKVSSNNDYVKVSLFDIYIKHEIILKPVYKQIIAENYKSDGVIFHHTLFGVFKVKFFPFPTYGNTIYLFEYENVGLIPIGYAVYR